MREFVDQSTIHQKANAPPLAGLETNLLQKARRMSTGADHHVVVFARPDDPHELRSVVQEKLGLNRIDAGIAVQHLPGVLPPVLAREQAEQLATAIGGVGVAAAAVPTESVPDVRHADVLHHLRCTPVALEAAGLDGEFRPLVNWGDVRLIAIGRVPLVPTRFYGTDTILRSTPVPQDPYVSTGEREGLECWLIAEHPLRVYRFDSEHMNYDSVDSDRSLSGTANFELLAAEVVRHAGSGCLAPAARAYLNHGPVVEFDLPSSADLGRYAVVQYLLRQTMQRK